MPATLQFQETVLQTLESRPWRPCLLTVSETGKQGWPARTFSMRVPREKMDGCLPWAVINTEHVPPVTPCRDHRLTSAPHLLSFTRETPSCQLVRGKHKAQELRASMSAWPLALRWNLEPPWEPRDRVCALHCNLRLFRKQIFTYASKGHWWWPTGEQDQQRH